MIHIKYYALILGLGTGIVLTLATLALTVEVHDPAMECLAGAIHAVKTMQVYGATLPSDVMRNDLSNEIAKFCLVR